MQDSIRSRSLPPQLVERGRESRLTLVIASEQDRTRQLKIDLLQNSETNLKMRTADEGFCWTNRFIEAMVAEEGSSDKNSKTLSRFLDMTECQKLKIQYAISFLKVSQQLDELRAAISANSSQPFDLQETSKEPNRWDCIDKATRLYNNLSADQIKFSNWILLIDEKIIGFHNATDIVNNDQSLLAEVLCDFNSDQGIISKQEIVRIIKIEDDSAFVSGRGYNTMRQIGQKSGLYDTLKSSIEREHHSLGNSGQKCSSCLEKVEVRKEQDFVKISLQIRTWIPLIYLQPLSMEARLMKKAMAARQLALTIWESYIKETAQAIISLLCGTFKHWNREKMDVDYGVIGEDMRQSLTRFFKSLEVSLKDDRECELHYDLILQQLRSLQSGDDAVSVNSQIGVEDTFSQGRNERIGQLMLEHRIIFRLLEKYEEIIQTFEAAKGGPVKSHLGISRSDYSFELFPGFQVEQKDVEQATPSGGGGNEMYLKCTANETCLLSPPPPFDKPPESLCLKTRSLSKKLKAAVERMEKLYVSEPCILEAASNPRHQTHSGRYRSVDLSIRDLDKCSRIRARSFGQGSKSLPRTSYPLPVVTRSPPAKPPVAHSVGDTNGSSETGYVVILRPNFRERITVVLDTRRRKRISIHTAIERGIAGFHMDVPVKQKEEEQMSEDDQKQRFFVYDTARDTKLDFHCALEAGIIHYDSSATENIVLDEYAKSEWRGIKSIYHPLVYRVEQVRRVIERDGKLIRQKLNWLPFHQAIKAGRLDQVTGEYVVRIGGSDETWGEEVLRLPFAKALAYGLLKVVPLRHCLIDKLPRDQCIFT